ncbi:MAG TPA: glycosyltransferase family 4 protein [Steroidobacteraceae bacterium]|nr:glycosyltransferase family 4 protein [Steroidobacteraceae bacterium]
MSPRVCFVGLLNLPLLAPEYGGIHAGGAELQQTLLAQALARRGFRVSMVVADLGQPDRAQWCGVTTYRAYRPSEGVGMLRFIHPRWTRVWDALRRADADVYYTSCAGMLVGEVAMFTRRFGRKLVFRVASNSDCDPGALLIRYRRDKWLYRYGLRRADAVLAQTSFQAQALLRNFARDSRVVPPLADLTAHRRAFHERDIDVLWVGNLRRLKRPELLLAAARTLPELRFHIVGGSMPGAEDYFESVRRQASEVPNVTFHGLIPYHEVRQFYERARVLAGTSEIEGFPNTYLQAWVHGTPVVSFLDPDRRIEQNALGRVVDSAEGLRTAIAQLARDRVAWSAASARCARHVDECFDEDRMVAPYAETFQELAARCRSVLMVGTHPTTKGGIRMVVQGYRESGLFRRARITYVATHWERSKWQKARIAIAAWITVAWQLARLDAPLVHVHVSSRASFWRKSIICLMARAARRPYILHVHGGEFLRFYEEECGPRAQGCIRRTFARAALVLALTEGWRERLSRMCPSARVEVLRNGVALPELVDRDERSPPRLLYLSILNRAKGTHDLVSAFARVAAEHPQWQLVCAGSGVVDEIRALASGLGIGHRVECTGWLDAQAKQRELAAATVFALPSYAEGLPMALLEAMAWGLPVVATAVGGIPGAVQHAQNGLLVPPGNIDALADALAQLLRSQPLRHALGAAARATIEREFSLAASIERLIQIYARFGIQAS